MKFRLAFAYTVNSIRGSRNCDPFSIYQSVFSALICRTNRISLLLSLS
nr:MAG TPA: hypothetical protein [Caudoviricetes sp.]